MVAGQSPGFANGLIFFVCFCWYGSEHLGFARLAPKKALKPIILSRLEKTGTFENKRFQQFLIHYTYLIINASDAT